MNKTGEKYPYLTEKDFIKEGFIRIGEDIVNDMGQSIVELPILIREDGFKITGGWWSYNLYRNKKLIGSFWWNTIEEFRNTLNEN